MRFQLGMYSSKQSFLEYSAWGNSNAQSRQVLLLYCNAVCPQTRCTSMLQLQAGMILAMNAVQATCIVLSTTWTAGWGLCRNLALLLLVQGWMPRLQLLLMSHAAFFVLHLQVCPTSSILLPGILTPSHTDHTCLVLNMRHSRHISLCVWTATALFSDMFAAIVPPPLGLACT